MAAFDILVWNSSTQRNKRTPSANNTFDFQSIRIGADNLEISQEGSGGSAAFNLNSRRLTGLAAPTGSSDAVTKAYADALAVSAGTVKEALLVEQQLDNTEGIRAAAVFFASAVAESGDTVILSDGTTTETWTFGAVDGANTPAVGANAAASMQNLANRINADSNVWGAVYHADFLDSINAGGAVVIYELATYAGASLSRIYGVWGTQANASVVQYHDQLEYRTSVAPITLPSSNPGAGRFGLQRTAASLTNGEIHLIIAADALQTWDGDSNTWVTLSAGAIPEATGASGGGIKGKATFDTDKGLEVISGVVGVKHDGEGLTFDTGDLALELDGGTLSKSGTGVKVADGGITGTQLNTSVAGDGIAGGGGSALSVDHDGEGLTFSAGQLALELRTSSALVKDGTGLAVNTGFGVGINASNQLRLDAFLLATNDDAGSLANRDFVYIKANGAVEKAQATVSNLDDFKLGMATTTIASAATGAILVAHGVIYSGFTGLTPGQKLYVSRATAGGYTQDLSAFTAGDLVYRIGRAISATQIIFDPEFEFEY